MRVFVTGGNGFVGSRVVAVLVSAGHSAHLLLRSPTSDVTRISVPFTYSFGDVLDYKSVLAAVAGCDACIHLACVSAWADLASPKVTTVTEQGTENMLKACAEAGVKSVIMISSLAACSASKIPRYCDEDTPFNITNTTLRYSVSKNKAENHVLQRGAALGLRTMVCCLGEVYGPLDFAQITCGNLVSLLDSPVGIVVSGGVSVVHVEDAAAGIVLALERGCAGERYILGGQPMSIAEIYDVLANSICGLQRRWLILPGDPVRILARVMKELHLPPPLDPTALDYGVFYWWGSSDKAKRCLGWTYRSAEDTLRDTLIWILRDTEFIKPKLAQRISANMGLVDETGAPIHMKHSPAHAAPAGAALPTPPAYSDAAATVATPVGGAEVDAAAAAVRL